MYNRDKIIRTMRSIKEESDVISPYVVILQPRRDAEEMPAQRLNGYEGLHIDMLGYSHGFCQISGEKVDVARNYLLDRALESGAKYALFVGEDTVLPHDGFLRLHETAEKNPNTMCVGVYYIKLSSPMISIRKDDWIVPANVDPGQVFEAWQSGLDAALIPMSILKAMKDEDPELPFCCIGYKIEDLPFIGEDNFFVYRLRKLGFKLLVNTDVQCIHMDLANGKYTAHPGVDLKNYFTNIPITVPFAMEDKRYIDNRWTSRLPSGTKTLTARCLQNVLPLTQGKAGLEIGGPSTLFSRQGGLPIYQDVGSLDNIVFNSSTIWQPSMKEGQTFSFDQDRPLGRQFIAEASNLSEVDSRKYDFVLSSHLLEHCANPLKAIREQLRVLKDGGTLILVVPHYETTFDRRRQVTPLSHLVSDSDANRGEDDLTHLSEVLSLHDLSVDPLAGTPEQFLERSKQNIENRCLHHHVFDSSSVVELLDHEKIQILKLDTLEPVHIIAVATKLSPGVLPDNRAFLDQKASWRSDSVFQSDHTRATPS